MIKKFNDFLSQSKNNKVLKANKSEEIETIELDMGWDESNKDENKAAKASFKKFKIKVDPTDNPGTFEVTSKKKDILAYLKSEFYEMDDDTIEEYYPELLN